MGLHQVEAMKTVVILQSNYIPWKGYFDLLHEADEFILYDDRQYTRQDWRNRNQVKTSAGAQWLTIPVIGNFGQRIDETAIADGRWAASHWSRLVHLYGKTPYFRTYADHIEHAYRRAAELALISLVNRLFIEEIGKLLGITTPIRWSTEFPRIEGKTEALVALCQEVQADRYVSGPAAKDYLDAEQFDRAGIALEFKNYDGYPEYPQEHPPFAHGVTVIDLLFNVGPSAPWYIWGWRNRPSSEAK